jgi:hypothetical protein
VRKLWPGAASPATGGPRSTETCCWAHPLLGYRDHHLLDAALLGLQPPLGSVLPAGDPSPVPTAVSIFGGERVPFPKPPRELAERYFTITAWSEQDRGGHFPAVAEPQLLAQTLRDVFRPLRGSR